MKIVFLDAATMGDASMDEIAALGEFVCYPSSTAEEARVRAADADVVLLNKVIVDQAFLDACPKLKLVCEAGTGINNINVKLCDARGVIVRNVAGYSTESVAQTAWMHILALAGRAFHYNAYAKDGRYSAGSIHVDADHPFTEIFGKTLGIVGMGAIGQKVAAIGTAFGMKVIYYSTSGTGHCKDYPCVSLDELLTKSDVISIHAPYNERTAGLIDYAGLCQMKPTAYLVNTGRGGIAVEADLSDVISIHAPYNERTAGLIDYEGLCKMKPTAYLVNTGRGGIAVEADLVRAIDEERIAGIGIDVYRKEPIPLDHPFLHSKHPERIFLTPHIAWYSVEARARLAHEMAENIKKGW